MLYADKRASHYACLKWCEVLKMNFELLQRCPQCDFKERSKTFISERSSHLIYFLTTPPNVICGYTSSVLTISITMWIIQVSFVIWCKVTKCASSRNFEKLYLSTFDRLLLNWTKNHLRRNKQLIKLVHNNVKTYRPFWTAAIVSRVCLRRKIHKL